MHSNRAAGKRGVTVSDFKSLNALMRHIRDDAGLPIRGSADKKSLAEVGYFHGYKGYRYAGNHTKRLPYGDFRELKAVIDFDTQLKTLFYPVLMKTEMIMKNLALVELLDAAGSSALADLYALMPGGKWERQKKKLEVIHACNETLLSAYRNHNRIVCHYYDSPQGTVPIWALMEVITLGQFGRLLQEMSDHTRSAIAGRWGLRRNNGGLVPHLVWTVTSLRNCVAHNGVVFDTRFATAEVRRELGQLLARELAFQGAINFRSITDYFLLMAYLAVCLGFPKREVYGLVRQYRSIVDGLRSSVSPAVFDMIVHTDNRAKVDLLELWVRSR